MCLKRMHLRLQPHLFVASYLGVYLIRGCLRSCWWINDVSVSVSVTWLSIANIFMTSGDCFSIKMPSYQNRTPHYKDKMVLLSSYLYNGNHIYGKIVFILKQAFNKIWWLCLVPTSATRFATDVGYRIAKKWRGSYKEMICHEQWHLILNREWGTQYYLTQFEDHFWIACLSYFLDPNMCGFDHVWGPVIPNSSGQLAELIVYIIQPE